MENFDIAKIFNNVNKLLIDMFNYENYSVTTSTSNIPWGDGTNIISYCVNIHGKRNDISEIVFQCDFNNYSGETHNKEEFNKLKKFLKTISKNNENNFLIKKHCS